MNHLEVFEAERLSEGTTECPWHQFCAAVEYYTGVDLDGDEGIDGYSLDSAFAAYRAGMTPELYVSGKRV